MLVFVTTLVGILGGLTAVFAFGLGVTKVSRLRQREQFYREALGVLDQEDQSRAALRLLHRAIVSEVIARHLTSPFRSLWPFGLWLGVAAITTQNGYAICDYLVHSPSRSYTGFSENIFGDNTWPLLSAIIVLGVFPLAFRSYLTTQVGRSRAAYDFFHSGVANRPATLTELDLRATVVRELNRSATVRHAEPRGQHQPKRGGASALRVFGVSIVPGLFAISAGLTLGTTVWIQRYHFGRQGEHNLDGWLGLVTLLMAISTCSMVFVAGYLSGEKEQFSLPKAYPLSDARNDPARSREIRDF